ncbi:hypothetical protein GCK72_013689 [Caenorhabditis remanei]|uniref:Serpentine Receptor, class H n=1 Tax=Caenorhabditis remanei TaxID=31234 RepID=A0A6A5GRH2_CAERE|nr:hypothetical protein GCK72_013689 [Caenorhabditis remanei]KAF1757234.1 hypothetical protein GCK72_013689 [Caenorhabditis remanei]
MSLTLVDYKRIYYPKCEIDNSFLASWQGLAYTSHSIQVFVLPIQILTFWLIVKKTPDSMKSVKWPLFVVQFWCTILDITVGFLITPYIFLPSIAFAGVGIFSWLGISQTVQLTFLLILTAVLNVSLIYLFESRSSSIENNIFKLRRRFSKCIYYCWNFAASSIILFSLAHIPTNQEEAKLNLLESNPCPTPEFFTLPVLVWLTDQYWISITFSLMSPLILLNAAGNVTFHAICSIYYLYLAPSTVISIQTRQLQRRFFFGVVIQTLVPTVICGIPYIIISLASASDKITQEVTNFLVIVIGCHGFVQSITVILVHKAYRHQLKMFLLGLTRKNGNVMPKHEKVTNLQGNIRRKQSVAL